MPRWLFTAACVLLLAAPLRAQQRMIVSQEDYLWAAELGGAVSIQGPADVNQRPHCEQLNLPCESPRTMPDFGILAFGAAYANEIIAVAGEVSLYGNEWVGYGTHCYPAGGVTPASCANAETNHVSAALAGIKLRSRLISEAPTGFRLFGQLLAGPQWSDVTPRQTVLQIGAGADDYLRSGLVLHVQYDYRIAPDDRRDLSTGRFLVGVAVPIGTR